MPTRALIHAGGLGTRLRPVYNEGPKPMAPIDGEPFLLHMVRFLKSQGVHDIVLLTGYLSKVIEDYFGDGSRWGVRIRYSVEQEPLGTAGALANARHFVDNTSFVLNGDTFAFCDLHGMLRQHVALGSQITIAVGRVTDTSEYGQVVFDDNLRVKSFREKEEAGGPGYANAGVYLFEPGVFDKIEIQVPSSIERDLFPRAITEGLPMHVFLMDGSFLDFGTPERWMQLQTERRCRPG